MKTSAILLLLLFGMHTPLSAQKPPKHILAITVLQAGTNKPVSGAEIILLYKFKEPFTMFTTNKQGRSTYALDKTPRFANISYKDLSLKSTFEQIKLVPGSTDTSFNTIFLTVRDSAEIVQIKRGLQKLPEDKNQPAYTCTDYTQLTTNANFIDSCFAASLHYPEKAREWNVTADLKVKFFVDTSGRACGIELHDFTFTILEEEILRALSSLSGLPVVVCKGQKFPGMYVLPVRLGLE